MFSNYIAMDIGTENIRIADAESGRIFCEPAVLAVSAEDGAVSAVGRNAKELMERVPGRYDGVTPVKNGMVADYNMLQLLLTELIRKRRKGFSIVQPKAVAAVPAGLSAMQKRELEDVIRTSGVREVMLIDAPVAGCIGMGEDISGTDAKMVLSVGAGVAEIAVICMNRLVAYQMLPIAGKTFDEAIARKIRRDLEIWIGGRLTETLKEKIGLEDPHEMETLCGKNLASGLPMMVSVNSGEIVKTLTGPVNEIAEAVREVLYHLPEELYRDIQASGLILIGGSVRMRGFAKKISAALNLRTRLAAYPENAVINGALQAAVDLGGYRKTATDFAAKVTAAEE